MVKSGLSVPLALLMTLTVYAGSAQLAALPLLAGGAPMWVVWAAAFCVNLRFVIFSAQWRVLLRPPVARPAPGPRLLAADLNLIAVPARLARGAAGSRGRCATSSAAPRRSG